MDQKNQAENKKQPTLQESAMILRMNYEAYINVGFTKQQAFEILLQVLKNAGTGAGAN